LGYLLSSRKTQREKGGEKKIIKEEGHCSDLGATWPKGRSSCVGRGPKGWASRAEKGSTLKGGGRHQGGALDLPEKKRRAVQSQEKDKNDGY